MNFVFKIILIYTGYFVKVTECSGTSIVLMNCQGTGKMDSLYQGFTSCIMNLWKNVQFKALCPILGNS